MVTIVRVQDDEGENRYFFKGPDGVEEIAGDSLTNALHMKVQDMGDEMERQR